MTKIKLNIHDLLVRELGSESTHVPATVDVSELLEFNDVYEAEFDVHELLAKERTIALIWSIDDVKARRRDLTNDQCWQVLQQCERHHDCDHGITWDTIEQTAYDLFGTGNAQRIERCEKALHGYSDDLPESNLIDFITDAMHWCRSHGQSFEQSLLQAKSHFANEADCE